MRILIVAMSESIHTARWLDQIADQSWDIHLFPSVDHGHVHPKIKNITVHHSFNNWCEAKSMNLVKFKRIQFCLKIFVFISQKILNKFFPEYHASQLNRVIKKIRPDIIHTLEIQHSAYLTFEAQKKTIQNFPPWIVTVWGSDLYLFGRLKEHEPKIRSILEEADYFSCECTRDVDLAYKHGFRGKILPVFPVTGGFDLESFSLLKQAGKVSDRRLILLKGYQTWAGRALVGLRALERCADILKGYEIAIYLGYNKDVAIAAELFSESTDIPVRILPATSNETILKLHGQARISIGLSISDGLPVSFLEALAMGSFPIQSWTACADEWIENGKTGILVPPEDPEVVEAAIRLALTDDSLVDNAAEENLQTCRDRLDYDFLKSKAIDLYLTVARENNF